MTKETKETYEEWLREISEDYDPSLSEEDEVILYVEANKEDKKDLLKSLDFQTVNDGFIKIMKVSDYEFDRIMTKLDNDEIRVDFSMNKKFDVRYYAEQYQDYGIGL